MKKTKQKRSFRQMNQSDRDRIYLLKKQGFKQTDIAELIGFDPSALSREINRRKKLNGEYDSDVAQHKANVCRGRSKYQGKKIEEDRNLKKYIIKKLKEKKSPDEISGRMGIEKKPFYASKNAIYEWLYSSWGQKYCKYLCTRRYKPKNHRKNKTKREMIPNRIS
ncbi:hypothetical protein ACFLY7_02190, partial [Patescibacteria group bacterium]